MGRPRNLIRLVALTTSLATLAGCFGHVETVLQPHTDDLPGADVTTPRNETRLRPNVQVSDYQDRLVPLEEGNYTVHAGDLVSFEAVDDNGSMIENPSFYWDFGDQSFANGSRVSHRYSTGANLTVRLWPIPASNETGNTTPSDPVASIALRVLPPPLDYFADGAETPHPWILETRLRVHHTFPAEACPLPDYCTVDETLEQPSGVQNPLLATIFRHPAAPGWHPSANDKFLGAKSWTFRDDQKPTYAELQETHMSSPVIAGPPPGSEAWLRFQLKGSVAAKGDRLSWLLSLDGGETWASLGSTNEDVPQWSVREVDLRSVLQDSDYDGTFRLRFSFTSIDPCGESPATGSTACADADRVGYFIDEIEVVPRRGADST